MQKTVELTLKGKTFRKWASGQNIYEFEKEINPRGILTLSWGYIHVYDLCSQTSLLVNIYLRSQVSVYRIISPLVQPCQDQEIRSWFYLYIPYKVRLQFITDVT